MSSMSEAEILAGLFPSATSPAVQAAMAAEKALIANLRNTENRTLSEIRAGTRAGEQHLRRASEETGAMQFAQIDYRDLSTVDKDSPDVNYPAVNGEACASRPD